MNNKICLPKKQIFIFLFLTLVASLVFFLTRSINRNNFQTSSKAAEIKGSALKSNTKNTISRLKMNLYFRKFKVNPKKDLSNRDNQYYYLANIILSLQPNSKNSSDLLIQKLYRDYYLKNKTALQAYNDLITKNYHNVPSYFKNFIASNRILSLKGSGCNFLQLIFSPIKCYCQSLDMVFLPKFCTDSGYGKTPNPIDAAYQAVVSAGLTVDPDLYKLVTDSIIVFENARTIISATSNEDIVGYDLTGVIEEGDIGNDQMAQLNQVSQYISKAQEKNIPIELEIGYGEASTDFYFNKCPANTLCLKTALNEGYYLPPVVPAAIELDSNEERGLTVWFNTDVNESVNSLQGVDKIYMIAPYTNIDTDDPINFTNLVNSSLNIVEKDGYVLIVFVPKYANRGINAVTGDYSINQQSTIEQISFNEAQRRYSKDFPFLNNPQSFYIGGIQYKSKELNVMILKKK
jgi:hypothetical protein